MILPLCRVVQVIVKHVFVLLRVWVVAIDVIENRILNPSKAEPAIYIYHAELNPIELIWATVCFKMLCLFLHGVSNDFFS